VDPRQKIRLGLVSYEYLGSHEAYASLPSSLVVVAQKGREDAVDRFLELTIASPRAVVSNRQSLSEGKAQAALIFHLIAGAVDVPIAIVIALVVASINRIALTQRLEELGLLHAVGYSRRRLLGRLTLETVALAAGGWLTGLAIAWLLFAGLKACVIGPCLELDLGNLAPIWFALPIPLALIALTTFSMARTLTRFDAVAIIERGKLSIEPGDQRRAGRRSYAPHSSTKPFSAWTFYLRHRRQGLTLVVTMALMTVGVAYPVFLFMPQVDAIKLLSEHLHYVSVVSPAMGASLDPGVAARIRTHPAVADAIPTIRLSLAIRMPPSHNSASMYGVSEDDMQRLLDLYGVRLEEGRLPRPRTNEIAVSRGVATNRSLHVGDQVGRPAYEYDAGLPTEMEVVGILSRPPRDLLDSDLWLGLTSYEYLRSHTLYSSRRISLLVVPAPGHKGEVDAWLEESVASEETGVQTYGRELRESQEITLLMALIVAVVESVLAIVAAAALAVLSYVFFVQRREEFGTLHAMGYGRTWLVLRTLRETVSAIAVAWLVAAAICGVGLVYVQVGLYGPKGLTVDFLNPAPWLFTLPMPLAVVAVSTSLVAWTLSRLDPVSIIERRA
jgi:putative ABC transport system permease protein